MSANVKFIYTSFRNVKTGESIHFINDRMRASLFHVTWCLLGKYFTVANIYVNTAVNAFTDYLKM
jgi:hypothetical protein